MSYELTSEGMEERQNLPIWMLQLDEKLFSMMKTYKVKSPNGDRFIKTIGDLVEVGKEPFSSYVHSHAAFAPATEMIITAEEQLAMLGLKMKGSDFTASNIRVSSLDIPRALEPVVLAIQPETLDDIIALGKKPVRRIVKDNYDRLRKIEEFLEWFGLKFEDTKFQINPENVFLFDINTLYARHVKKVKSLYSVKDNEEESDGDEKIK